jgi:hypothetical protein
MDYADSMVIHNPTFTRKESKLIMRWKDDYEWKVLKYMVGGGHDLFMALFREFVETQKNHDKYQDSRDSIRVPTIYNFKEMSLHHSSVRPFIYLWTSIS